MTATPAHYAYARQRGRITAPWLSWGVLLSAFGVVGLASLSGHGHGELMRAASAVLTLIGAALVWIGVWRGWRWAKAHPFEGVAS